MGRYLDIAKKFEARQRVEQEEAVRRSLIPPSSVPSIEDQPPPAHTPSETPTRAGPEDFPLKTSRQNPSTAL
jgi:hypothetical protein